MYLHKFNSRVCVVTQAQHCRRLGNDFCLEDSMWFCDTSIGAATRAARCGSFVGGALISWSLAMSLAMDEHSGHGDLRGSDRLSVIPYVHGRMELYCLSLPCLSLPPPPPFERGVYPVLL
jgi:hypothetical protein